MHVHQLNEASQVTFNPPLSTFFPEDQLPDIMKSLKKLMIEGHKHPKFKIPHNALFRNITKKEYVDELYNKKITAINSRLYRPLPLARTSQQRFNINDLGTEGYLFLIISSGGSEFTLFRYKDTYKTGNILTIHTDTEETSYEVIKHNQPFSVRFSKEDPVYICKLSPPKKKHKATKPNKSKQVYSRMEKQLSIILEKTLEQTLADITGRMNVLINNRSQKANLIFEKWQALVYLLDRIQYDSNHNDISKRLVKYMLDSGISEATKYYNTNDTKLLKDIANGDGEKYAAVIWYAKQLFIRENIDSLRKKFRELAGLVRNYWS